MGLIYLDTCLLIYLAENHPQWGEPIASAMENSTEGRFCISPLIQCECLVGPLKRGDTILERRYRQLFTCFVVLDMPQPVYLEAAQLRARFGLKTPDALHLACAHYHNCDALWTNDDRLAEASLGLVSNILR